MGKAKNDFLPEFIEYRDSGCDLAPSCLSCPFEVCRYDIKDGVRTLRLQAKYAGIIRLADSGKTKVQIAKETGNSLRTVDRALKAKV